MNKNLRKLFFTKNPYNEKSNNIYFLKAIKNTTSIFLDKSNYYKEICNKYNFKIDDLNTIDDIHKIPILPTLFLKRNDLSIKDKSLIEVTSSGTKGKVTKIGYSLNDICLCAKMAITLGLKHKLFSLIPTHYIMLGYEPTRKNKAVISKTAYLSTWYALGISRTYALTYKNGKYNLNLEKLQKRILRFNNGILPVRIVGFPSYMYFLLKMMKGKNIICKLPKRSKVLLGGGWKQFSSEEISKEDLFSLIEDVLGIEKENINEFFGAAEHPVLYCTCKNHNFHVPVYGKVIIRDVSTLKPVKNGQVGLINLLTPIESNIPIVSVMTDDIGILHDGSQCGCGIETDYFEILGRVGVSDIKTCSVGAKEYLREIGNVIN